MARNICGKLIWVAKECVVLIQKISLTAESADPFKAGQVLQFPFSFRSIQFRFRWPLFRETGDLLCDHLLHLSQ